MNKLSIIIGLLIVIMAFNASAYADIHYHFNENNVVAEAYDCLDNGCYSVGKFSGSFPDGNTTTNGELTIIYPSSLATPYGYAVYYFAEGMLPMEGHATWHTYGDDAHHDVDYNIYFSQKDVCHSTIDTFSVTNDVYANEPLIINMDSSLDATTYSAFHETFTGIGYVPPEYKDEYYSADTRVILIIRDSNGIIVHQQIIDLTAANGNPLYMDTSRAVQFTWTPTITDTYTSTVMTQVIDNQCAASEDSESSKDFTVYPARPQNECYTILNSLATDDPYPEVNHNLGINYTKISNYADNSYVKTPVGTAVTYLVVNDSGAIVHSTSTTLAVNPDDSTPAQYNFNWQPAASGWYNISVSGFANSGLCAGLNNPVETLHERIYVADIPTYNLRFHLADSLGAGIIEGAHVDIGTQSGDTDANGEITFTGLDAGTYSYTITHGEYQTVTGSVQIVDVSMDVMLTMTQINRQPVITAIPNVYMDEGTANSDIDLDDHVIDSESADSELVWVFTGNSSIGVSIGAGHVVTFTAPVGFIGSEDITFIVYDPQGASDSDTMTVYVDDVNQAPVISGIPDISIDEDTQLFDAVHLPDYASDAETPSNLLQYSIIGVSDANCGVSLGTDLNIDIQPVQDWNGACDVTVEVSDGTFTGTDIFTVTVGSVTDAPIITSSPIIDAQADVAYTYDVAAYDPDNDTLTYSLTTYPSGMTINSSTGLIQWLPNITHVGSNAVTVDVSDGTYTATQLFIITVLPPPSPMVTINAQPSTGYAPMEVNFTSSINTSATVVGYVWNFGDGNTPITAENATNIYTEPGTYTATLTVLDSNGQTGTGAVIIRVYETNGGDFRWTTSSLNIYKLNAYNGDINPGDTIRISINFENVRDMKLDNLKVTAAVPDLAIWSSLGPFRLRPGKDMSTEIELEIPEYADAGLYDIRISLTDDAVRKVKVRQIRII